MTDCSLRVDVFRVEDCLERFCEGLAEDWGLWEEIRVELTQILFDVDDSGAWFLLGIAIRVQSLEAYDALKAVFQSEPRKRSCRVSIVPVREQLKQNKTKQKHKTITTRR